MFTKVIPTGSDLLTLNSESEFDSSKDSYGCSGIPLRILRIVKGSCKDSSKQSSKDSSKDSLGAGNLERWKAGKLGSWEVGGPKG